MKFHHYVISLLILLLGLVSTGTASTRSERRDRDSRQFTGGSGWGSTREEIIENRNNRKRQFRNLVNHMRKQLADHSAGEKILEPQEKADMERRMDLYSRKLDSMQEDLEDQDIERIVARSQTQQQRREVKREDILSTPSISSDEL